VKEEEDFLSKSLDFEHGNMLNSSGNIKRFSLS